MKTLRLAALGGAFVLAAFASGLLTVVAAAQGPAGGAAAPATISAPAVAPATGSAPDRGGRVRRVRRVAPALLRDLPQRPAADGRACRSMTWR